MSDTYDVIIVGGGPAGSHLALRLARAGRSVVLLDRKRFPRAKPCGEFMGPECLPLLEQVGLLERVLELGAQPVARAELYGYGRHASGRFGRIGRAEAQAEEGRALGRERLDAAAIDAARGAGVEVRENWSVARVLRDESAAVLGVAGTDVDGEPFELRARFTVGADGIGSRVARSLGVHRRIPWLDRIALSTRVDGAPFAGHAEVHYVEGGYFAIAPVEGGRATLNLVIDRADLPGGRPALRACLDDHLARAPELRERLTFAPDQAILACGPLATTTTAQTFDGAALVGDACGYVDPMTGEGLFFAMRGAALLAESLAPALSSGSCDRLALEPYRRARRREFMHRRAMGLMLQRSLRHPRIASGILRLLEARPRMTDLMMGMTGTSVPPRELLRPSVWLDVLTTRRVVSGPVAGRSASPTPTTAR
jgi:menaquinone-9 beta-reductase